jgi:predicted NBD/HSP70 family sugar kinase/DNA-binding XRE family transcriptional regulator
MKTKIFSGNQSFLKELNIITSIRTIRSKGLISRSELADTLGLNRSTITTIMNKLVEEQWVKEVGTGHSLGGRPPKLLQFNSEAAYIICIDWTPQFIKLFICDLSGIVLFSKYAIHDPNRNARPLIEEVLGLLKEALADLPQKPLGLLGIGIGVPGIVDRDTASVSSYDLGWDQVPLAGYFAEVFECPVIIENIANVGLTAERYHGCAFGEEHVCYLRLNQGISASILYEDQIYRGHKGFTGNVGHLVIDIHGKRCSCGNRGCWKNYASERALLESYGKWADSEEVNMKVFIKLVKENNTAAVRALHEFSEYLGVGIANLINTLNPSLIVIDSAINEISSFIGNSLHPVIDKAALPYPKKNVKIVFSTLGEQAIVYGATAMVLDRVFASPSLLRI